VMWLTTYSLPLP